MAFRPDWYESAVSFLEYETVQEKLEVNYSGAHMHMKKIMESHCPVVWVAVLKALFCNGPVLPPFIQKYKHAPP